MAAVTGVAHVSGSMAVGDGGVGGWGGKYGRGGEMSLNHVLQRGREERRRKGAERGKRERERERERE